MSEKDEMEVSESQIAVHWQEEDYFSLDNFPDCFKEYADLLDWDETWHTTLDTSDAPLWKWFVGGKLNVSYNCIDRHLAKNKNKTAIHFVPDSEEDRIEHITYQELYIRVNEVAAVFRDFCGLKAGDRATLHLPMTAELPITMLALARLGVIHSVVFGGFSPSACADRAVDSKSRILVTIDGYYRGGKWIDHKANADEAYEISKNEGHTIEKVLVWQRHPSKYSSSSALVEGRDYSMNEVLKGYKRAKVDPVSMPAEAPLFLMYTSGTTGKPKGCQHSTGGYLAYAAGTSKYIQDIHPEDVYWCMADIGWITGHSYIVYGPLSICASSVVYEGVPNYPDAGRCWRIAEELDINIFHTAPTVIRALRKIGPDEPAKYNYSFKHMTTVGEPIEPAVWKWYHETIGKGKAVIVDTWWQTETGGFLCTTLPGISPMKPGSAGPGAPGIHPIVLDEDGKEIKNPWPGGFQTVYGDRERYIDAYYGQYCKDRNSKDWRDWPYLAGDAAVVAADGYFRILGRIDDVINVSGHRLGTKEIESAALNVEELAEAAVVPVAHEVKGKEPDLYVSLKPGFEASDELAQKVSARVCDDIGKIARPRKVWIVPDMPKTRSGKIMRRVLGAISNKGDVGNIMTLANPEIVDEIRKMVQGE
jgi:acetyl-CoA synthetase